jgi:hypothetical protein
VFALSAIAIIFAEAGTAWCQPAPSRTVSEQPTEPDDDEAAQPESDSEQGEDEQETGAASEAGANTRFEFGVRTGFGIPFGKASGAPDDRMKSSISSQLPIWGDLGVRFAGRFFVGVHASYGFAQLPNEITAGCTQCKGSDTRVGLEVLYHLPLNPTLDLWFGAGLGWEWLSLSTDDSYQGGVAHYTDTASGPELFMLQAGIDYQAVRNLGIGPFIALSNDEFSSVHTTCRGACGGDTSDDTPIENKTVHQWFFFGVRASWRP